MDKDDGAITVPNPIQQNLPMELRNEVFGIIARGLDFNEVKSLARHLLELEENDINNIVIKYGDSRAMKVLNLYEHKSDSKMERLPIVLRYGLQRPDLADSIERLLKR